jgi:PRC-barrel domain
VATLEEALAWRGRSLTDQDGDSIGTIEEIYLDADTHEPAWALVNTGLFGTRRSFVPLAGVSGSADDPSVPFEKSLVKNAPQFDPDGQLSRREEAELYRHYGLDYPDAEASEGDPRMRPYAERGGASSA